MATRTVYACETCQPLHKSDQAALTPPRRKALAAATTAKVGTAHSITHTRLHTPDYTHLITHTRFHTLDYTHSVTHTPLHTLDYTHSITHTSSRRVMVAPLLLHGHIWKHTGLLLHNQAPTCNRFLAAHRACCLLCTPQLFRSHCAPDPDDTTPAKLPVARLRAALQAAGLSPAGTKAALVARLEQHQARPQAPATPPVAKEQPPCATVAQLKEALRALGLPTGAVHSPLAVQDSRMDAVEN